MGNNESTSSGIAEPRKLVLPSIEDVTREVEQQLKEKKDQQLRKLEAEKRAAEERKLKEPWRKFERNGGWNNTYQDRIMNDIQQLTIHDDLEKARILFIGPIKAGKSSFINSVATVDKNRISNPMESGSALKSLSKKLKQYIPKQNLKNFILMDTMGVEEREEEGFNVNDVIYLIEGNVKPDYKFNPRSPISKEDTNFKSDPILSDKAHCVVIVLDSNVIDTDSISDASKLKIEELQEHIRTHEVPAVIILTKIDSVCEEVSRDITTTYHSRPVELVVKKASELFGIPKNNIFPVRNYSEEEADLDENMNILILLALRKMMEIARDRLENKDDNK